MNKRELKTLNRGDTILIGDHRQVDRVTRIFRATFRAKSLDGASVLAKPAYGVERGYRADHVICTMRRVQP